MIKYNNKKKKRLQLKTGNSNEGRRTKTRYPYLIPENWIERSNKKWTWESVDILKGLHLLVDIDSTPILAQSL